MKVSDKAVGWALNMLGCAANVYDDGRPWFGDDEYLRLRDQFRRRSALEPDLAAKWGTMLDTWRRLDLVEGNAYSLQAFGVFVDLGTPFPGLVEIPDASPERFAGLIPGQGIRAVIRAFHGGWSRQVKLSMQPDLLAGATREAPPPLGFAGHPGWPSPSA